MGQCKGYGYIGRRVNRAHAKANTLYGGALELGDLRLLEDGGERGAALVPDGIASEPARNG